MTDIFHIRNEVADWFEEQSKLFIEEHKSEIDILWPRVTHIRRVAALSKSLATELHWQEDEVASAEIIGYLHDIGRFSQYTEYQTFVDSNSVDHTKRAMRDIEKKGILDNCPKNYREIILEGVRYHNSRNFKNYVQKKSVPFVRLIRDADKLEKYLTLANAFDKGIYNGNTLNIAVDGPVNPLAVKSIQKRRKIQKKHIHSQLDYHLLQLSWIFEVSYPETVRKIIDSKVINRIVSMLPDDELLNEASRNIFAYLKRFET